MKRIMLDNQMHVALIQDIKNFISEESNIKLSDIQTSNLLEHILNKVEDIIYNQAQIHTRCEVINKLEEIIGIEKKSLH